MFSILKSRLDRWGRMERRASAGVWLGLCWGLLIPAAAPAGVDTPQLSYPGPEAIVGIHIDGQRTEFKFVRSDPYDTGLPPVIDMLDVMFLWGQLFTDRAAFDQGYIPVPLQLTGDDPTVQYSEAGLRYRQSKPKPNWSLYFGVQLNDVDALSGPVESRYELLIDVYPEKPQGCPDTPWKGFRPDYRFMVTGKEGRIEKEYYQVWGTEGWQGEGQADAPEFDTAVGEIWECQIPWASIGMPLERSIPYDPDFRHPFMLFALRSCQGESCDYFPELQFDRKLLDKEGRTTAARPLFYDDMFMNDQVVTSVVSPRSWGAVKRTTGRPSGQGGGAR